MKRRDFLKFSSIFAAAGMVLPSAAKSMFSKTAKLLNVNSDSFSLEVITDRSDYATGLLEQFAKEGGFTGNLSYSEFPVAGSVMGDLVFVRNNTLLDYTKSADEFALKLREMRKKLNLPSMIENPVRLRLFRNSGSTAKDIIVAQKGRIIARIDPDENNRFYSYRGNAGKFILNVSNGTAKVSESECRHKICKQMSSINKQGDYIACIPNEIQIFAE